MKLEKTIIWRRTVRKYVPKKKKIKDKVLNKILEAGRLAPSSLGLEVTKVLAIQNDKLKLVLAEKTLMKSNIEKAKKCDTIFLLLGLKTSVLSSEKFITDRLLRFFPDDKEQLSEQVKWYKQFFSEHYGETELKKYVSEQVHIATSFMTLQAANLKLGTTIMGGINSTEATKVLNQKKIIDKNYEVILALAIGYFDINDPETFLPQKRIPLQEFAKIIK